MNAKAEIINPFEDRDAKDRAIKRQVLRRICAIQLMSGNFIPYESNENEHAQIDRFLKSADYLIEQTGGYGD